MFRPLRKCAHTHHICLADKYGVPGASFSTGPTVPTEGPAGGKSIVIKGGIVDAI